MIDFALPSEQVIFEHMSDANLTLSALFQQAGTELKVYDMGRRIRALGNDEFLRIEQMQTPYPSPYLQHAWIALLLLNPRDRKQNAVWFLKLPLDEQGYMVGAVRDDLLGRLLSNVEQSVAGIPQEDALKENPFSFKPSDQKMAVFHALAARQAGEPASAHYEAVQAYLQSKSLGDQWEHLALQGLADLVVRLDQSGNEQLLAQRLAQLPQGLETHILGLLEHAQYSTELQSQLIRQLQGALSDAKCDAIRIALILRGLSPTPLNAEISASLVALFKQPAGANAEVLSAIATRCENWLMEPALLHQFLEALARGEAGQVGFSRILADLMFLPVHRVLIMRALRQHSISEELKSATETMFGSAFRNLN